MQKIVLVTCVYSTTPSSFLLDCNKEKGCDLEKDYFYLLTNETYRRHLVTEIKQYEVPFYIE